MSRKASNLYVSKETPVNEEAIAQDFAAADALALATREADARTRGLATQLKYEGSLVPDALENGARDAMRRINMGLFELGGYLLLMRETCGHGDFMLRLERLDLQPRVAQQYMQVTKRFSNANTYSHLGGLGKGKLLEMLVLDDEQIEELELTGQTGELNLDSIATMSVRELRAALRESREEKTATDKVLADKNAAMDKLRGQLKRIQTAPRDQQLLELQKEATSHMNDALGAIRGQLRQALIALRDHDPLQDQSLFSAGLVGQLAGDLAALREEFNLPDVSTAAERELAADTAEWAFPSKADN